MTSPEDIAPPPCVPQHPWLRDWGGILTSGVCIYALVFCVWLAFPIGAADYQQLIGDLVFLPLGLALGALAWRASAQLALDTRMRWAWRMIALAYLVNWCGDVLWLYYDGILKVQPFPSWADAGYLAFYPLMLWGLLLFPNAPQRRSERLTFWIDTATVLLGSGMLIWYFILRPIAVAEYASTLESALSVAYPLGSMVLLFGVSSLALRHPAPAMRQIIGCLVVGQFLNTLMDFVYGYMLLQDMYQPGSWVDGMYVIVYTIIAVGATLQYRYATRTMSATAMMPSTAAVIRLLPYLMIVLGYSLLVFVARDTLDAPLGGLIIGAVALTGLVVARQIVSMRENTRLLAEQAERQSEARFRSLVQHASDIITIIAPDGTIRYVTPSAERVFGYPTSALTDTQLTDLLHPDDLPIARSLLAQALSQPWSSTPVVWRIRHQNNAWVHVEILANNLLHDPSIDGLVLTMRDIGERRARDIAEAANRAKSTFLANMSHELRTPLSAIIGYTELLQLQAQHSGQIALLPDIENIWSSGRHLLALINDVLDLSKIEAGWMQLTVETFDLPKLISDVTATVHPLLERNGNRLDLRYADDLGAVNMDMTKLRQVLLNLLSNAAKFTSHGMVTLEILRESHIVRDMSPESNAGRAPPQSDQQGETAGARADDWIIFRVTDTGIGMSEEQMQGLFHPFVQAAATTTRLYGGTGLGLAISQRYCQLMGGTIFVASAIGSGSTFTVRLPATCEELLRDVHDLIHTHLERQHDDASEVKNG